LSFLAMLSVLCLPIVALAQEGAPAYEIFGGYSFLRANPIQDIANATGFPDKINSNGFNIAFTANLTRHIGGVVEFGRLSKSTSFNDPISGSSNNIDSQVYPILFGLRYTPVRGKVEPFVHGLFGAARASAEASALGVSQDDAAYAFAFALGGGVDIKVHKNLAVRVAQLDYLGARSGGQQLNNLRFTVGVVLRLGSR
jgi:opacity protein-like surface antigen